MANEHQNIIGYLVNTLLPSMATLRIGNIYDREVTDLNGTPAATVTPGELEGEVLDNYRNRRMLPVQIRIFIARDQISAQLVEQALREIADELVDKLDADITLGGNCIYTRPHSAEYGYVQRATDDVRVIQVLLECVYIHTWRNP
jgi:predicted TIM-barrel enzyme